MAARVANAKWIPGSQALALTVLDSTASQNTLVSSTTRNCRHRSRVDSVVAAPMLPISRAALSARGSVVSPDLGHEIAAGSQWFEV